MRNIGMALVAALALALPAQAKSSKAEVTCGDGTTSKPGRGACSHHGGVASKKPGEKKSDESATKPPARADRDSKPASNSEEPGVLGKVRERGKADTAQGRTARPTPRSSTRDANSGTPTARCKDGTTSYSAHHSGTCSGHGGVAEWLDQ
jgi:hypothetical protein